MLGSRLIDSTAQSLAGQFFTRFAAQLKSAGSTAVVVKPEQPTKKIATKPSTKKTDSKKAVTKKTVAKKKAKKR
jgi:uncharacterized protein